jgi:hypothetical protein
LRVNRQPDDVIQAFTWIGDAAGGGGGSGGAVGVVGDVDGEPPHPHAAARTRAATLHRSVVGARMRED